jgi:hypothetical protein
MCRCCCLLAGINALVIKQVAQVLLEELHALLQAPAQTCSAGSAAPLLQSGRTCQPLLLPLLLLLLLLRWGWGVLVSGALPGSTCSPQHS